MPYQNDLLRNSEIVALTIMLDRLIPFDDPDLKPSNLKIINRVIDQCIKDDSSKAALMKIIDALSLDIMSSAVGGFAALTNNEQTKSILEIEKSLPEEFNIVLGATREAYYENTKTAELPSNFNSEKEIFGKVLSKSDSSNQPRNVKGTQKSKNSYRS